MPGIPRVWPLPNDPELQRQLRAQERNAQGLQFIRDDIQRGADSRVAFASSSGGDKVGSGVGVWQPLDAGLTAIAALADAAGVLTNDGAGVMSWAAGGGGGLSHPQVMARTLGG